MTDLGAAIEAGARGIWEFVYYIRENDETWETAALAIKTAYREESRAVLEAALPALLAAGWLSPDALEQVGWCWSEEGHGHPAEYFPYEFTACRMQLTDPDGQADDIPVYRLAAGWRPPDE